ncbi:MAG: AAA family ATPase [Candidatus Limnocylindria bacterium]
MAQPWPLVGRAEEIALITQIVRDSNVHGVFLSGAAGVGKTRLAREAVAAIVGDDVVTDWAVATRSAQAIPFGALAHLLPADPPAHLRPMNLLRAMADALVVRSDSRRLVLGVDDAHLLDTSSAALLHHLALTGGASLLVTARTDEPLPDAITALWKDRLTERLELQPLSQPEVDALLEKVLGGQVDGGTRQQLWELTRGNPLFLREVLQAGIDSGSFVRQSGVWLWTGPSIGPRLMEVVQARVGALGAAQRQALELVAIGEPLEGALLGALLSSDDIAALERGGLLQESTDGRRSVVRLSHPLYAEVIRATTPPARTRQVYRTLAAALEKTAGARREDALRLATWHLEAGIADRPAVLANAAERALRLFDPGLAARLAGAAFDAEPAITTGLVLARAMDWQGRYEEAEALLAGLERYAQTDATRAEVAVTRADNLMWQLAQSERALQVLDSALRTVRGSAARDLIRAAKGYLLALSGQTDEAVAIGQRLLARRNIPDRVLVYAYGATGHSLLYTGRPQDALRLLERHGPRLVQAVDATPYGPASMGFDFHRYLAAAFGGRLAEAATLSEGGYRAAVEGSIEWWTGTWASAAGWAHVLQGRPKTAIRWLREGTAQLRQLDTFGNLSIALAALAQSLALAGEADEAEETLAEADVLARRSLRGLAGYNSLARVWIAIGRGELSRAIAVAVEEGQFLASMNLHVFRAMALHDLARLGVTDQAVAPLEELATHCQGELVPSLAAHATALAEGSASALDRASRDFERLGSILFAAESSAEAAAAYRREGLTARAAASLSRAKTLAAQCEGARTPRLAELDVAEPLTRREKEVVSLAARRLTNREIARRLGISVRTVDNHLHRAYDKLDLSGRHELAEAFGPAPIE